MRDLVLCSTRASCSMLFLRGGGFIGSPRIISCLVLLNYDILNIKNTVYDGHNPLIMNMPVMNMPNSKLNCFRCLF